MVNAVEHFNADALWATFTLSELYKVLLFIILGLFSMNNRFYLGFKLTTVIVVVANYLVKCWFLQLKELEGRINTLREQAGKERVVVAANSLDGKSYFAKQDNVKAISWVLLAFVLFSLWNHRNLWWWVWWNYPSYVFYRGMSFMQSSVDIVTCQNLDAFLCSSVFIKAKM